MVQMSGATMFNLSLLTSDMWAVVVRIFIYRQEVDWLYYLAFSVVLIGLVLYSLTYVISTPSHLHRKMNCRHIIKLAVTDDLLAGRRIH